MAKKKAVPKAKIKTVEGDKPGHGTKSAAIRAMAEAHPEANYAEIQRLLGDGYVYAQVRAVVLKMRGGAEGGNGSPKASAKRDYATVLQFIREAGGLEKAKELIASPLAAFLAKAGVKEAQKQIAEIEALQI